MDINGYYMAAVPDPVVAKDSVKPAPVRMNEVAAERYFNAGVLYINLERVKEKGSMKNEVLDYLIKNPNAQLLDQDALNSIYRDGILFLDSSWNYYARFVRINGENCLERKIYHYVGTSYTLYYQNEMDRLYYETVSRTPWGRKQGRKIIDDSIGKLVDRS